MSRTEELLAALNSQGADSKLALLREEQQKKLQGEKDARRVISSAIERWAGYEPHSAHGIPIVRDGKFLGFAGPGSELGHDPVEVVLSRASALEWRDLTKANAALKEILKTLEGLEAQIGALDLGEIAWFLLGYEQPKGGSAQERVIYSIGYLEALLISTRGVAKSTKSALETNDELIQQRQQRKKGPRGRPRTEARYGVSEEFGRLFARVTGERPTYADGTNGPSGKFTPALRDVFKALGWGGADISGPCKAARDAVMDEDLNVPRITSPRGLGLGPRP